MVRGEEKRVGYRVGLIQWNTEKASRREGGKQEGERVRERGFSLRYVVYHLRDADVRSQLDRAHKIQSERERSWHVLSSKSGCIAQNRTICR